MGVGIEKERWVQGMAEQSRSFCSTAFRDKGCFGKVSPIPQGTQHLREAGEGESTWEGWGLEQGQCSLRSVRKGSAPPCPIIRKSEHLNGRPDRRENLLK